MVVIDSPCVEVVAERGSRGERKREKAPKMFLNSFISKFDAAWDSKH
jgi:hypothetical protein